MKHSLKEFKFFETYETASYIEAAAAVPETFIELPWEESSVQQCIGKFSKLSILHFYIFHTLAVDKRFEYRKNLYDRLPDDVSDFKRTFEDYNISLRPEDSFNPYDDDYNEYDHFFSWYEYQEEAFIQLWERITDEVFYLLFANRGFLLTFNNSLASYLRDNSSLIPANYLTTKGTIKRASNLPVWLRKAVYFRDQGRCVLCHKDLTGLLNTTEIIHYDHIVPLDKLGVNDPCNMQLLCEDCNLSKGASRAITSSRYKEWW